MSTITGPTILRPCGYCESTGFVTDTSVDSEPLKPCPLCTGSGSVVMDVAPFVALERAMEHIQAIRTSMGLRRTEKFKPKIGTPAYHVNAAEDAIGKLFQELVVMLPDEYERTEG